jgi:carbon monoxide dehydrogenase subunit G
MPKEAIMGFLKTALKAIVILAILLAAVSFALPGTSHVQRDVFIDRPPAEVFAMLNSYGRFNEWSPWFERDPKAEYRYEGPASGVGASMRWASQKADVGSGRQTIVESVAPTKVVATLEFDGQSAARATFALTPQGNGTRVAWSFDTEHGMNPVSRWFGLFFDRLIGPDYEKGLAKLKTTMETGVQ